MVKITIMKFATRIFETSNRIQEFVVVRSIRDGLVGLIPVLIIGAFALVLENFPIPAYIEFIKSFWGGAAICLLIAILIFSRNRARRDLGYTASFPHSGNEKNLVEA
jgi:cellobiose-specific phosphotransferase system component IIC